MKCLACQKRVKTWNGSDPKCAFESSIFSSDNWNCETVSLIRRMIHKLIDTKNCVKVQYTSSEQRFATVDISDINIVSEDEVQPICLYIGWYKDRGCTECMWLMFETQQPRAPTEEECLKIIKHYTA